MDCIQNEWSDFYMESDDTDTSDEEADEDDKVDKENKSPTATAQTDEVCRH